MGGTARGPDDSAARTDAAGADLAIVAAHGGVTEANRFFGVVADCRTGAGEAVARQWLACGRRAAVAA